MNFADIETLWRSPDNRLPPAELENHKMKFVTDLKRRHRGFLFFIIAVIAMLTVITIAGLVFVFSPTTAAKFSFSREWGVLLVLALPWMAAVFFLRNYVRHCTGHRHYERSIVATVRALLDDNRMSVTRLKVAAMLHAALLVVLPLVVHQLRAVGKAGNEVLVPAFVIWPLIALGIGAAMWIYYRRTLRPERARLEALLASYQ